MRIEDALKNPVYREIRYAHLTGAISTPEAAYLVNRIEMHVRILWAPEWAQSLALTVYDFFFTPAHNDG